MNSLERMLLAFDVMVLVVKFEGKVGRTLYGCTNVERQTKVDNYPVNMLRVNCIDRKKTIQTKDNLNTCSSTGFKLLSIVFISLCKELFAAI